MIVDLSVDFDFFSREPSEAEWGHREDDSSLFSNLAWQARYISSDLYELTSFKHADFSPKLLKRNLLAKGLRFDTLSHFAIADSHLEALDFFRRFSRPDLLINIDAHHDCWPLTSRPTCGNWITALVDHAFPELKIAQVYPKWKDPALDGPPHVPIQVYRMKDWAPPRLTQVRNLFICKSPVWVPPHHDPAFIELVRDFSLLADKVEFLGPVCNRVCPTKAQAQKAYRMGQEQMQMVLSEIRGKAANALC